MLTLALYTTVYPAAKPFLAEWHRSVAQQTDKDFALWIAIHGMEVPEAIEAMQGEPPANWLPCPPGDTPAQVRQRALEALTSACDGVVLVDSDDILHPARVASARRQLESHDLAGCALRLVDRRGCPLGPILGVPASARIDELLPRNNVWGLSNTAWRSSLLERCLPIPAHLDLVDWYLVTQAWLLDAAFAFDNEAHMDYRQHGANMVRVIPPFAEAQVQRETELLGRHFRSILASPPPGSSGRRLAQTAEVAGDIETFAERVVRDSGRLTRYVRALNELQVAPVWGTSVAHPLLRHMWTFEEGGT